MDKKYKDWIVALALAILFTGAFMFIITHATGSSITQTFLNTTKNITGG